MQDCKISVIIPVYNVEAYLEQCVESVAMQTYENKEIILIDDGSTDGSAVICDRLAEKYRDIIRLIHKENQGLSSARNEGIVLASGNYIMFLDSDDYWDDPEALRKIVKCINKTEAEVIVVGLKTLYCHDGTYKLRSIAELRDDSNINRIQKAVATRTFIVAAWDKVIKKSLFERTELYFVEGITEEDYDWCIRLLLANPLLTVLNECFLVHRIGRVGSIQNMSVSEKKILNMKDSLEKCLNYTKKAEIEMKLKQICQSFVAHMYLQILGLTEISSFPSKNDIIDELKTYRYLLSDDMISSVRWAKTVDKIFGYRILCFMLGIRMKKKISQRS